MAYKGLTPGTGRRLCWILVVGAIAVDVTSGFSHTPGVISGSGSGGEFVEVRLTSGRVRGQRRRERYDIGAGAVTDLVDQYFGIPYASAPVGRLRFQAPRPPSPWVGVLNATVPGWVCPQIPYYNQTSEKKQNEDCLNLNIYSPSINDRSGSYPVMVFIHGGSYEEGAGIRYDGFSLAAHGVVVVTINYRLGALGYLSSGDSRLSGNYGLLDQIEALTWIRHNIHHFRGNPDQVTIFGNSAGASSVGLLLMSPKSKGLFHAAIMESGPPLSFWAVHNATVDHATFTRQVARRVGCQNESLDDVIECLRRVPARKFMKHHWKFPRISPSALNFKPRVDGDVLVASPQTALESGGHHHVPVLIGVVEEEWARSMGWFYRELRDIDKEYSDGLDRGTFERSIEHVITQRFWWPRYVADVITHSYTDWTNVTEPILNRVNYVNFMSDFAMVAPSVKTASILARQEVPVYLYRFYHRSVHTQPAWWGSYHSLELDYVFGSPFTGYDIAVDKWVNHTEQDKTLSRRIMKMWTDFAIHRSPTPENTSGGLKWQRFSATRLNYLYITATSTSNRDHLRPDKMALWNDLIPKLLPDARDVTSRVISPTLMTSPPNYQMLAWVFLASSVSFFTSFVVVVWKLLSLKGRERGADGSRYYNGQPPQMV